MHRVLQPLHHLLQVLDARLERMEVILLGLDAVSLARLAEMSASPSHG